jgi:hypothetical protein
MKSCARCNPILPLEWKPSRLPNPALRGRMGLRLEQQAVRCGLPVNRPELRNPEISWPAVFPECVGDHPGAKRSLCLAFYPTSNPYFAAWVCRSFHFAVVLEPDGPAPLPACTAPNTLPAF